MLHKLTPLLALPLLAAPLGAQSGLAFTDVSASLGVEAILNTESVAWGDVDNDGDDDLYLTHEGFPNQLLRNDGGGRFTDVTASARVGHTGWSVGAAFGDLDNDGDLDLYVVSFGEAPDALYRNEGPVGTGDAWRFTDLVAAPASRSGITERSSSRGVTLFDLDNDGLLDIYVNAIGPDLLYRNLGEMRFENVAGELGVAANDGQGVGVVASDLDHNGWVDLFTGNRSGDQNRLFLNFGGLLLDLDPHRSGVDKVGLGMGVIALDHDHDLDMDLYWTTWPGGDPEAPMPNAFYENLGDGTFADITAETGTEDALGWGISANVGDVDNDSWEDFVITNGFSPASSANVLYHHQGENAGGGPTFVDVTEVLGGGLFDGRGGAFADFDLDGDLDLVITGGPGAATRLWRNDLDARPGGGGERRWVTLRLAGTVSNASAIGARIVVRTDRRATVKEVASSAGRGSGNSLAVEFGLGDATRIEEVVVYWPSGIEQRLTELALDQFHTVVEPPPVPGWWFR